MKAAIMGYGVVGSGVGEILINNADIIEQKLGDKIEIKHVLDLRDFPGDALEDKLTKNFEDIVCDEEVTLVCEAMGGTKPAYDFTKRLLEAGKHVVTSNKELVATYGYELLQTAKAHNVNYLFEASVGGGVPILRPLWQCLAANHIERFYGILNGTTNFILTKMYNEDMPFDEALRLAQELGYAEKDPTADIAGADVCRKTCILASISFGTHIDPEQVQTQGIQDINIRDVSYAKANGYEIKLLGYCSKLAGGKIDAIVSPFFVPKGNQIATVSDVFNGIVVVGDMVDEVFFYGRGAGSLPTASACVADMIDCAMHTEKRKNFGWGARDAAFVENHKCCKSAYFVRGEGDINAVKAAMGDVSFLSLQGAPLNEVAFITPCACESELDEKLAAIADFRIASTIRVLV
ncbi:MAG: homoserine dehydrogenase [Clostridia bacterium]|nr:homoserine dehydrogenase [Clostridia bacterium]